MFSYSIVKTCTSTTEISTFLFIYVTTHLHCTIDMNIPEFRYLSDHLSLEECRKLVASLHFTTFELPAALAAAERKVPEDEPCLNLLVNWNSGNASWEGRGKTHQQIEHRLRQIGRNDLADWLGKTVFHQLAVELNRTVLKNNFSIPEKITSIPYIGHEFKDANRLEVDEWSNFDTVVWVVILVTIGASVIVCLKIIKLIHESRLRYKKAKPEEMVVLNQETDTEDEISHAVVEHKNNEEEEELNNKQKEQESYLVHVEDDNDDDDLKADIYTDLLIEGF